MNRFFKIGVVVTCLLVCGAATVMVPTGGKMDSSGLRAMPVNNGRSVQSLWLKV